MEHTTHDHWPGDSRPPSRSLDNAKIQCWDDRIPPEYRDWRLEDFSIEMYKEACHFLEKPVWCMFLTGKPGSRKTSFAVAIMWAWWLTEGKGWPVLLPAYKAVAKLRDLKEIASTMEAWKKAPLLVLDDIGSNRATPHIVEQMLFLIQYRYDWQLPTIITSNLSLPEFAAKMDDKDNPRAISRIQTGILLDLGDKDWRKTPNPKE